MLIGIIPKILKLYNNVRFIIGGDGDKMDLLVQLLDKYSLHDRVELLGGLKHSEVRDVLCRGHIFLNTSLTESFCIAILEAACCGLMVVSTDVGGVPEVLPPHMALLSPPEESKLFKQLCIAIQKIDKTDTSGFYDECKDIYSWWQIAERTERVYDFVWDLPIPNALSRIKTSLSWGFVTGIWSLCYILFEVIVYYLAEFVLSISDIDIVRNFNTKAYMQNPWHFGNLCFNVRNHEFATVEDTNEKTVATDTRTHYNMNEQTRY